MNNWNKILEERSADYRLLTFWSWNNKLEESRLKQQIRELKAAGFGGFFMHARYGLKTEYLSDEWYSAIECCAKEAKEQGMSAWCYDENGYPSGFAGMKLLDNPENLARYVSLEETKIEGKKLLCSFFITKDNKPQFDIENNTDEKVYYIYENSSPATVDPFNKRVVDEFIKLTHEAYYEKFGEHFGFLIEGFFTDEPQYYRYGTPYSSCLEKEYEKLYGESLIKFLPYLFLELDGYKKYRWRYYKLANDLYTNVFVKTVYDWCKSHNCKLTGHTIEESLLFAQMWCCAGVMPFYEYEDIPGCDWLGRKISNHLTPKQVGSVAQQLGKKQTLTESFACTGWDANPRELKRLIDWQYANGINLLCTHLIPYSMEGSRKYDHPSHFSSVNPMFSKFSVLSKYITNLGCMMGESREFANVGVIHPIHSAYLTYNRKDDIKSIDKLEKDFDLLLRKLQKYNIPYHLIDETLLSKYGKVEANKLTVGLCKYDKILVPSMEQIDETTAEMLKEYILNGGKIHIYGQKPSYVSGEEANLDFLKTNIEFENLKSDIYYIDSSNTKLSSVYRSGEGGNFVFVYNEGDDKQNANYYIKANGAAKMDLVTKDISPLFFEKTDNGYIKIAVELDTCESEMILLGDYESDLVPSKGKTELEISHIDTKCIDNNILVLDTARLSYDGENYSEPMYIEAIQAKLLKEHYCGKIYLRYFISAKNDIKNVIIEAEKMNSVEVKINNQRIFLEDKGIFDPDFVSAKILSGIVEGENNFDFCIDYHQNDRVYEVLDKLSPEVESLINCLVYDTELAPISLYGDFSVRGENGYFDEEHRVFCYSNPFVLSEKNNKILKSITSEGFPFYAGRIEYTFEVSSDTQKECLLKFNERFSLAHIKWNEYETDLVLSDKLFIPAEHVKAKNQVTITLTTSNRNRLGPHHWVGEREPLSVWTNCFNMCGSWDNGYSEQFNPEYAFVEQRFSVSCYQ